MTATRPRVFWGNFSRESFILVSKSATNCSNLPICTGLPFLPSTQCPWHCFSWGQTRPQMAGKLLLALMMDIAAPMLPMDNSCTKSGISLSIGHPLRHWGILQCRQRLASSIASRVEKPSLITWKPAIGSVSCAAPCSASNLASVAAPCSASTRGLLFCCSICSLIIFLH